MPQKLTKAEQWTKQLESMLNFVDELVDTPTIHGHKWKVGMLRHYNHKLLVMLKRPPRTCKKYAKAYQRRIDRAFDRLKKQADN